MFAARKPGCLFTDETRPEVPRGWRLLRGEGAVRNRLVHSLYWEAFQGWLRRPMFPERPPQTHAQEKTSLSVHSGNGALVHRIALNGAQ